MNVKDFLKIYLNVPDTVIFNNTISGWMPLALFELGWYVTTYECLYQSYKKAG